MNKNVDNLKLIYGINTRINEFADDMYYNGN